MFFSFLHFFIYQVHIHVLKVKSRSPGAPSVSYLGSQPARICSKKLRVCTAMLLVEALSLNKCLLGDIKSIYKMKSLKGRYTIT